MKTCLFSVLSFSVLWIGPGLLAAQEKPAAPQPPMKLVPTPGRFDLKVTSGDREKSFTHPAKAVSEISRALSRLKRTKDGEAPVFEAVFTLNDQAFTFSDPEAALEACKALTNTMRDLPKLKMGLGDLGTIPEVKAEDIPAPAAGTPKSQAAAVAEVKRRIQMALQKQLGGGRGGYGGRPSMPNPATIQRTIQQEVEKARAEGLLPPLNNTPAAGGGFAGGDPREARKEAIVQSLALVLGKASSTGKAEAPADAKEKPEAKPEEKVEAKPEEK